MKRPLSSLCRYTVAVTLMSAIFSEIFARLAAAPIAPHFRHPPSSGIQSAASGTTENHRQTAVCQHLRLHLPILSKLVTCNTVARVE